MIDTLVMVGGTNKHDMYIDLGRTGAYALDSPCDLDSQDHLGFGDERGPIDLRGARLFAVDDGRVEELVEALTKEYGSREIKIFKLSAIYAREIGPMLTKRVEGDGVLP